MRPVVENPEPVKVAFEIVMDDPPELVMTSGLVCVLPTATPVKLTLAGLAAKAPTVTPAPDNGMLSVGFEALLKTVILPVTLAAAAGENVAVKLTVCPD